VVNRAARGILRCSPEPTAGSIYNLGALRDGQFEFAIVQSDWQGQAFAGTGPYAGSGPITNLRSVMSLYPETLTVLARADSGIARVVDLVGKRVDIGHPASGRRATVDRLMVALETEPTDFSMVAELPAGNALDALCAGTIDATLLIVGHPNAAVARALANCDTLLVPFAGPAIDAVLAESSDFEPAVIPAGTYPGLDSDISSFAVMATIVTLESTDSDLVSTLVSRTLENLPALGQRAPVLSVLDPSEMATRGLTAPIHPGGAAAFAAGRSE
jgi:TRAP transporter TAXI family solute receptor